MDLVTFEEIKKKEQKLCINYQNVHPRDENIIFLEDRAKEIHNYYVKNDSSYTSVSKLYKKFFSYFDEDKCIYNMMSQPNWCTNKYYGMTKEEIKEQWKNTRDNACALGVKMHDDIEHYINYIPVLNNTIEYSYFLKFYNNIHNHFPGFYPFRTEWRIYDEEYKIAGSIDFAMKHIETGQIALIDWKRTTKLKDTKCFDYGYYPFEKYPNCSMTHYSLQLNIYRTILIKNYNLDITRMVLAAFHPDLPEYQLVEVGFININLREMVELGN